MKSRDEAILEKILKYIEQVEDAHRDYGHMFETFKSSTVYRNACCMCVLQIGELCKALTGELRNREGSVPWREWCGIRDVFAHQYAGIDIEIAWNTLEDDLPLLKENVGVILKKMRAGEDSGNDKSEGKQ